MSTWFILPVDETSMTLSLLPHDMNNPRQNRSRVNLLNIFKVLLGHQGLKES